MHEMFFLSQHFWQDYGASKNKACDQGYHWIFVFWCVCPLDSNMAGQFALYRNYFYSKTLLRYGQMISGEFISSNLWNHCGAALTNLCCPSPRCTMQYPASMSSGASVELPSIFVTSNLFLKPMLSQISPTKLLSKTMSPLAWQALNSSNWAYFLSEGFCWGCLFFLGQGRQLLPDWSCWLRFLFLFVNIRIDPDQIVNLQI